MTVLELSFSQRERGQGQLIEAGNIEIDRAVSFVIKRDAQSQRFRLRELVGDAARAALRVIIRRTEINHVRSAIARRLGIPNIQSTIIEFDRDVTSVGPVGAGSTQKLTVLDDQSNR